MNKSGTLIATALLSLGLAAAAMAVDAPKSETAAGVADLAAAADHAASKHHSGKKHHHHKHSEQSAAAPAVTK